ncbi:hypothetical protein HMPREF0322_01098 [Desulfitobacterium hafniense DP7]|uniref:Uncharacterized protein n=1 Tax=Desulfitobacterium hafniense DP7 TaxID=537010 RepID=G9XJG7_DESHA|nr:hypothetical protein HMPREF0322_01098 [Desulfitobacterium hafniense DP7]
MPEGRPWNYSEILVNLKGISKFKENHLDKRIRKVWDKITRSMRGYLNEPCDEWLRGFKAG